MYGLQTRTAPWPLPVHATTSRHPLLDAGSNTGVLGFLHPCAHGTGALKQRRVPTAPCFLSFLADTEPTKAWGQVLLLLEVTPQPTRNALCTTEIAAVPGGAHKL